jgi:hypothetical protein
MPVFGTKKMQLITKQTLKNATKLHFNFNISYSAKS